MHFEATRSTRWRGPNMVSGRPFASRAMLCFAGVVLAVIGLHFGFEPQEVTLVSLGPTVATSHVRVAFGGFHLGVGLYCVLCAIRRELLLAGQIAAATVILCAVIFRLVGIWLDTASSANLIFLAREAFILSIVVASFWLSRKPGRRNKSTPVPASNPQPPPH